MCQRYYLLFISGEFYGRAVAYAFFILGICTHVIFGTGCQPCQRSRETLRSIHGLHALAAFDGGLPAFGAIAKTVFFHCETVILSYGTQANCLVSNRFYWFIGKAAGSIRYDHRNLLLSGGELYRFTVACSCIIGGVGTYNISGVRRQICQFYCEVITEWQLDVVVEGRFGGIFNINGISEASYCRLVAAIIRNGGGEGGAVLGNVSGLGDA